MNTGWLKYSHPVKNIGGKIIFIEINKRLRIWRKKTLENIGRF